MNGCVNSPWDSLPRGVVERIATLLPPNEAACTLRLVNKLTSTFLNLWTLVRLSEPVPRHAFVRRWGHDGSARDVSLEKRQQLLRLTARSGVIANLELVISTVGCPLTNWVLEDAANAGHLEVCKLLVDRGCPHTDYSVAQAAAETGRVVVVRWVLQRQPDTVKREHIATLALVSAASAGNRDLCDELLAAGAECRWTVAGFAAQEGHAELTFHLLEQLMQQEKQGSHDHSGSSDILKEPQFIVNAVYGLELQALRQLLLHFGLLRGDGSLAQSAAAAAAAAAAADATPASPTPRDWQWKLPQLFRSRQPGCSKAFADLVRRYRADFAAAALASPTLDWRAKFDWLEAAVGCRLGKFGLDFAWVRRESDDWTPVHKLPQALERVALLRRRGCLDVENCLTDAIICANLPVLQYLRRKRLLRKPRNGMVNQAAHEGDTEVLSELVAAGPRWRIDGIAVKTAANAGHLHVLQWMAGPEAGPGAAAALAEELAGLNLAPEAASSGKLEVLVWLRERGCDWDWHAFESAAMSGNVAMLEYMAAEGCPMADGAFVWAASNGDLATLRCLRRLGCPWDAKTFSRAVHDIPRMEPSPLAALRWLAAQGCPVDWREARDRAERRVAAARHLDREAREVMAWIESHN